MPEVTLLVSIGARVPPQLFGFSMSRQLFGKLGMMEPMKRKAEKVYSNTCWYNAL